MNKPVESGISASYPLPGNPPGYLLIISPDELSDIIRCTVAAVLNEQIPPILNERIAAIEERVKATTVPSRGDYLTRRETSALLHITLATLNDMEKRRELLPVRIGRRVLYRRSDIENALRRG